MKRQIGSTRRNESTKRPRKIARKCPCCGSTPCVCNKFCLCQELKAVPLEDELDDVGVEDTLRFGFL